MLTIGQALFCRPKLLMIDELSLGLAPAVVALLLGVVRELRDRGTTVIVVEQSVNVAVNLAGRAVFMEKGMVKFTGPTVDLIDRPDLLRAVFLGSEAPRRKTSRAAIPRANVSFSARNPCYRALRATKPTRYRIGPRGGALGLRSRSAGWSSRCRGRRR